VLKTRRDVDGLAIRYSRYYDNSILSIDIATVAPVSAAEGWIADLFYSHIVPYRNWDIYLNAGLTYYSQDVVDYYIGVDADEISPLREEFRASHAMRAQFEIFAQRPISQSWTFNVGLSQSLYTHNITQSPIVNQQDTTQIMAGVLYVF
jgi:outer membrane protein